MIQLRDKQVDFDTLCKEADSLLKICQKYNAPLIINDNADVVIKTGADGVHLGQNDMELAKAREILGKDKIIGGSARTIELAKKAEQSGADYIGSGAVFGTLTKADAKYLGTENLKKICDAVVVSAIFGADNICSAAQKLRKLADSVIYGG